MWFESLFSLKINLEKSELILVENVFYVDALADELEVASLPTTYLEMLLDAHSKRLFGMRSKGILGRG